MCVGAWDVSNLKEMSSFLNGAKAITADSMNLSAWDTGSLVNMWGAFKNVAFNSDIRGWDVSQVTKINDVLNENSAFNYDLSGWDLQEQSCDNFNTNGQLTTSQYPPVCQ